MWVEEEEREEYRRGDVGAAKRIMHAPSRDLDLQAIGDRPLGINSASFNVRA